VQKTYPSLLKLPFVKEIAAGDNHFMILDSNVKVWTAEVIFILNLYET